MQHLTLRVAWHDSCWNGCVCRDPSENSYCVALDRIREERDDEQEQKLQERPWNELTPETLPPCKTESEVFMSPHEGTRAFVHPYADSKKTAETHGHLKKTLVNVPEFSAFAVLNRPGFSGDSFA